MDASRRYNDCECWNNTASENKRNGNEAIASRVNKYLHTIVLITFSFLTAQAQME